MPDVLQRKHLKIYLIAILLFSFNNLRADPLSKAYKLLNAGDFVNAQIQFNKVDPLKYDVGYYYGLAQLYSAPDNENRNVDEGNKNILEALKFLPIDNSVKSNERLSKLGVRDATIKQLHQLITSEAFQTALKTNTIEAFNHFIDHYQDVNKLNEAINKRNALAYSNALIVNTSEAYFKFISDYPNAEQISVATDRMELRRYLEITKDSTYNAFRKYLLLFPNGKYVNDAKKNYDRIVFFETIQKGNINNYIQFINNHSSSPYKSAIEDSIYLISIKEKSINDYENFIDNFPDNRNIPKAWQNLYNLKTINYTENEIRAFELKYPNHQLKEVIEYDLQFASKPIGIYKSDGKFGYIDATTGDTITKNIFYEASPFSGGLAVITTSDCIEKCKYGYIMKDGKIHIPEKFDYAEDFINGFAVVGEGNCTDDDCKYGIIDKTGMLILPIQYDEIYGFSDGLALVGDDVIGYGFSNTKGELVIALQYEDALPFSEIYAPVKLQGKWYYINQKGEAGIKGSFKQAGNFSEGLAPVSKSGVKWGYINNKGEMIIEEKFNYAGPFKDGIAKVLVEKKSDDKSNINVLREQYIDREGNPKF